MRPITEEKSRDRYLSDPEIVRFWHGCDALGWPYGGLFKLLLLTAQRRDEVATIEWKEIDLERETWTLPSSKSKNGIEHDIALSSLAVEIIQSLPRVADRWVFTKDGERPLSGWSASKTKLDALIGDMPDWRLHDLRRTAATGMARLGIRAEVADKVLNHSSGGSVIRGVAAIYQRHEYRDERRAALETWGRHIERLIRPAPNVVRLAGI